MRRSGGVRMSAERWLRLVATLEEAGVERVTITERPYAEERYGRLSQGVQRSILLPAVGGATIEIGDQWWSKNTDKWIGWSVCLVGDDDDIIQHRWPLTKKRADVRDAVLSALKTGANT